MDHFLAVSFSASLSSDVRSDIGRRGLASLAAVSSSAKLSRHLVDGSCLVTSGFDDSDFFQPEGDLLAGILVRGPRMLNGPEVSGSDVAEQYRRHGPSAFSRYAAPFAAVLRTPEGHLAAVTDTRGLRHVYWHQADGWAVASSSSMALALLAGKAFDEASIGAYALVGSYLSDATPFKEIKKLDAGCMAVLLSGRVRRETYYTQQWGSGSSWPRRPTISSGAEAVGDAVASCIAANPDAAFELSGGMDSRLVVAAVPPSIRRGRTAITIGGRASDDVKVARSVAKLGGLAHIVVDLDALADLDADSAVRLCAAASARRDHSANALAAGVLDWIEERLEGRSRITGQNGEFARGFYYAGQRAHSTTTRARVARLARWRIFANERVDEALFAPGFLGDVESSTIRLLQQLFRSYDTDWLRSTDAFYLNERMQRWVGTGYTASCTRRQILSPFFDPSFINWSRDAPAKMKRGSRLFAGVLCHLDAGLGAIPLESGSTPERLARPTLTVRASRASSKASKIVRKIGQRFWRAPGTPPVGASLLARRILEAWTRNPQMLENLANVSVLNGRTLEQIAAGHVLVTPASIGMLTALGAAMERLDGQVDCRRSDVLVDGTTRSPTCGEPDI